MRDMNGATELAAAEAVASARSRPEAVTSVLAAVLDSIDGAPATPDRIRAMRCADREWLLQWASFRLHPDLRWFEGCCERCGEPYDLSVDLSHPAYSGARRDVPGVTVETSIGTRHFAVPTGEHEERLALLPDGDPRRGFAGLCGLSEDAASEALQFDEHDLDLIDEAIEAASPDIADCVAIACPACAAETRARLDPLRFAFPHAADILGDVHLIARGYGWSLHEILGLKAQQRGRLAGMILRERRAAWPPGRRA